MSIESVMPSNHPILCHPLLFPPSFFPTLRWLSLFASVCLNPSERSPTFSLSLSFLPYPLEMYQGRQRAGQPAPSGRAHRAPPLRRSLSPPINQPLAEQVQKLLPPPSCSRWGWAQGSSLGIPSHPGWLRCVLSGFSCVRPFATP